MLELGIEACAVYGTREGEQDCTARISSFVFSPRGKNSRGTLVPVDSYRSLCAWVCAGRRRGQPHRVSQRYCQPQMMPLETNAIVPVRVRWSPFLGDGFVVWFRNHML